MLAVKKQTVYFVRLLLALSCSRLRLERPQRTRLDRSEIARARVTTESWDYNGTPGQTLKTPHYAIHTTIKDPQVLKRLPQVMEGGYAQYQMFVTAPMVHGTAPMNCYVFSRRQEWADFTKSHTGTDSAVYLQITRGGYCIGDWFVSYYVGDTATFSVAAHEGWHQYVARHFKGRCRRFWKKAPRACSRA